MHELTEAAFSAVDELLGINKFVDEFVRVSIKPQASELLLDTFAISISSKPEIFSSLPTFNALHQKLQDGQFSGARLRCLSRMTVCQEGLAIADDCNFLSTLVTIFIAEEMNEQLQVDATAALRNCLLSPKAFHSLSTLWCELVRILIHQCYTKENRLLQKLSIQALRVMSDKASVKHELQKVYLKKVKDIPCLGGNSTKLLKDLVQWLGYQNYKSCEAQNYSKLFI